MRFHLWLDNKDYYGFPLGTCAYLIAIQKKRLGAYEEAIHYLSFSKKQSATIDTLSRGETEYI